eukprot:1164314-Alexandrium_andersonii.AAC.1
MVSNTVLALLAFGVSYPTHPPTRRARQRCARIYPVAVPAHEVRVTAETRARPQNSGFQAC